MWTFCFCFYLKLGLYDCWVSKLCLSVCPSEQSYVWHGVCLFVRLNKLCLAWGLSVCPSEQVYVWHGVCL